MKRSICSFYLSGLILGFLSLNVSCGTVYKTVLREGTGQTPVANQTVIVHYTGTLQTGEKFDSSHDRNEPFKFKLGVGEVIRGWDAGVISMRVGERARLEIAHEDAYGVEGLPPVIPPSAKLIFDIELLGIDGVAPPQNAPVVQTMGPFQPGSQQTSQGFQNGQGFPPPGLDFPSMTQTFGSGASQGQMFTPPEPPVNNQVQQFRGSTLRQDQVFPATQQQQQQPQTFGGSQGQTISTNPPQTFGSQNQGFQTSNQGQPFGANQGQIFNAQRPAVSSQGMPNQPIGPGMNSGFQNQPMQPASTQIQTSFSNPGQPFQAPSQDFSRRNPALTQGRQEFNNFPGFSSNPNQQSSGVPSLRQASFGSQQFSSQQGIQGTPPQQRTPPQQTNNFRPQEDLNNFPTRRFDQQDMQSARPIGRPTRNQVPDLSTIDRQSVDLRPRQDSFGTSRDRGMPQGGDFPRARSSRFAGQANDFSDRRLLDRTDPGMSRGEVGLDPSFPPEVFPGRDFGTSSRNMGGNVPNFFGSRNRFSRDSRTREPAFDGFPGFNSRSFRGMGAQPGFLRDRMMFDRSRLARMRRGF